MQRSTEFLRAVWFIGPANPGQPEDDRRVWLVSPSRCKAGRGGISFFSRYTRLRAWQILRLEQIWAPVSIPDLERYGAGL